MCSECNMHGIGGVLIAEVVPNERIITVSLIDWESKGVVYVALQCDMHAPRPITMSGRHCF